VNPCKNRPDKDFAIAAPITEGCPATPATLIDLAVRSLPAQHQLKHFRETIGDFAYSFWPDIVYTSIQRQGPSQEKKRHVMDLMQLLDVYFARPAYPPLKHIFSCGDNVSSEIYCDNGGLKSILA
jgi:hypothetical protein